MKQEHMEFLTCSRHSVNAFFFYVTLKDKFESEGCVLRCAILEGPHLKTVLAVDFSVTSYRNVLLYTLWVKSKHGLAVSSDFIRGLQSESVRAEALSEGSPEEAFNS